MSSRMKLAVSFMIFLQILQNNQRFFRSITQLF
jgi:hypothetical protein